jgi:hypothetical protein
MTDPRPQSQTVPLGPSVSDRDRLATLLGHILARHWKRNGQRPVPRPADPRSGPEVRADRL